MNILLTSCGRRSYMVQYFRQALNHTGKVFASNSEMTYALSLADEFVLTPNIYEDSYIPFLIDYCKKNNISAIISLFDIDLPILAKNKELFKNNGITVVVSDYKVTQICNDKWQTALFLSSIGVNTPKTFVSLEEFENNIKNLKICYPIFVKPRWGMGSIGISDVYDNDELRVIYKRICRIVSNTYLKYESSATKDNCIIFQEKVTGQEYGMEILNDLNGEFVTVVAKRKIALRAGETDIAEIVNPDFIYDIAVKISKSLRHIGNLDVDFFVDNNGNIIVLEMNCRFGGQYPFSHLAGADFPSQIITWLQGGGNRDEYLNAKVGVKGCKDLCPTLCK